MIVPEFNSAVGKLLGDVERRSSHGGVKHVGNKAVAVVMGNSSECGLISQRGKGWVMRLRA
jgi:hypothetical protein